jgi:hypothetical protein
MATTKRFEDRLLAELRAVVAENPVPDLVPHRRPRPARLALAGAAATAAIATVTVLATGHDGTGKAYAVEAQPDGEVTVSIHSLKDAAGLQSALRDAGVPAVVDYVPNSKVGCVGPPKGGGPASGVGIVQGVAGSGGAPEGGTTEVHKEKGGSGPVLDPPAPPTGAEGKPIMTSSMQLNDGEATFTIDPGEVPDGQKVFITTSSGELSSIGMAIAKQKPSMDCATQPPAP